MARVISYGYASPTKFQIDQAQRYAEWRVWVVPVHVRESRGDDPSTHYVIVDAESASEARELARREIESRYGGDWYITAGAAERREQKGISGAGRGVAGLRSNAEYDREIKDLEVRAYAAGRDHARDVIENDGCDAELFGEYEISSFGISDFDPDFAAELHGVTEAWTEEVRPDGFVLADRQALGRKVDQLHRRTWLAFVRGFNEQLKSDCPDADTAGLEGAPAASINGLAGLQRFFGFKG